VARYKGFQVAEDARQLVEAAQTGVEVGRHRVDGDAQLVQPGFHQRVAAPFVQQHAVGVEEHMSRRVP
jgi:hypothetical protein